MFNMKSLIHFSIKQAEIIAPRIQPQHYHYSERLNLNERIDHHLLNRITQPKKIDFLKENYLQPQHSKHSRLVQIFVWYHKYLRQSLTPFPKPKKSYLLVLLHRVSFTLYTFYICKFP